MAIELKGLKGLGHLDGLLQASTVENGNSEEKLLHVSVTRISPGQLQPRKQFDQPAIDELAQSIIANGIIQPLIVRSVSKNSYEIIAGERRWRAAKQAKIEKIPVIIRQVSDETALAFALIENIQRERLNPIEEAHALERLKTMFKLTHQEIAERVGRSRTAVTNYMRLITLSDPIKQFLQEGKLEVGHAKVMLTLDLEQQLELAEKIMSRQLTVRATEKLARHFKSQGSLKSIKYVIPHEKSQEWSNVLSKQLLTKAHVQLNQLGQGKVVIHINSEDDINRLVGMFNTG